jgi:competence protein ComEA
VSAFAITSYFHQKKEITRKEKMLRDYFTEINITGKTSTGEGNQVTGEAAPKIPSDVTSIVIEEEDKIFVYICGEVSDPGVYEIDGQSRLSDVLELCGGATESACLEAVNLAKKIVDGERIYIPSIEESGGEILYLAGEDWSGIPASQDTLININLASIDELKKLPGIGDQIAKNIIDHRQKFGPFQNKEDIKNVTGIGDKKYAQIEALISI